MDDDWEEGWDAAVEAASAATGSDPECENCCGFGWTFDAAGVEKEECACVHRHKVVDIFAAQEQSKLVCETCAGALFHIVRLGNGTIHSVCSGCGSRIKGIQFREVCI